MSPLAQLYRSKGGSHGISRSITDADRRIAVRVAVALEDAGVLRKEAAQACGVSPQQFTKYLAGRNRMSAGTLQVIADLTGRAAGFFFDPPPACSALDARAPGGEAPAMADLP